MKPYNTAFMLLNMVKNTCLKLYQIWMLNTEFLLNEWIFPVSLFAIDCFTTVTVTVWQSQSDNDLNYCIWSGLLLVFVCVGLISGLRRVAIWTTMLWIGILLQYMASELLQMYRNCTLDSQLSNKETFSSRIGASDHVCSLLNSSAMHMNIADI